MDKKRELLPGLHAMIIALNNMSADTAKLELMDNDQASRRLKKSIADFKHNELASFTKLVFGVRAEINSKPPRKMKKKEPEISNKTNINQ